MAYETASANDPNDLLNKLRVFALANGWTVNYYGGRTNAGGALQAGNNQALSLTKSGRHWVLYRDLNDNRIWLYMHTDSFNVNLGTELQVNRSTFVSSNNLVGPFQAYHFFTDSAKTYLHVVVEVVVGRFSHFNIGLLDKTGGGDSVPYASGLRWEFSQSYINSSGSGYHSVPFHFPSALSDGQGGTVLRADCDGIVPRYYRMNSNAPYISQAQGGSWDYGTGCYSTYLLYVNTPSLTGRAVLVPMMVTVNRGQGGGATQRSIVGAPHDMRWVVMNTLNAGDIVTIGADQWRVFPVIRKNGLAGMENSSNLGYAYRVVS